MNRLCFTLALLLPCSPSLFAQGPPESPESHQQNHQNPPRANQGRIPRPPPKANAQNFKKGRRASAKRFR